MNIVLFPVNVGQKRVATPATANDENTRLDILEGSGANQTHRFPVLGVLNKITHPTPLGRQALKAAFAAKELSHSSEALLRPVLGIAS